MALATTQNVADRLGRELTGGEETTVEYLLDAATAVILDAVGKTDEDDIATVPKLLEVTCVELVCRSLANPSSLRSLTETMGSATYSASFRDTAGLELTPAEERRICAAFYKTGSGSARTASFVDDVLDLRDNGEIDASAPVDP